jgi:hypothetical protein
VLLAVGFVTPEERARLRALRRGARAGEPAPDAEPALGATDLTPERS